MIKRIWKIIKNDLERRYRIAQAENDYKIQYKIVGNGVLVIKDPVQAFNSGAFQEQLRQSAELERFLRKNNMLR